MKAQKKWTIGRILLLILGILLAGLLAAAAITFPYYDSFQKPARSYEAPAREMETLEDVYLPDKPPEDTTEVSYTYQLKNRFLWSKPTGYGLNWVESVEGTKVEISVGCAPAARIAGPIDFYIKDIEIENFL